MDSKALAHEILTAYAGSGAIPELLSARFPDLNLNTAYAVDVEFARLRGAAGHRAVGRKIGFVNRALWPQHKIETVLWGRVYDDTVRYAPGGNAALFLGRWNSPKIEPEVVFHLKRPIAGSGLSAADVLDAVDWLALGFELVDNPFPGQFAPSDFVAAYGLHRALVVGAPLSVDAATIPSLVEELARFPLRLLKNGALVEEGSGRNVLGSPALCLAELVAAVPRQAGAEPLVVDEVITTGSLTTPQPIAAGETWRAEAAGLPLASLTLRLS
jgi:2-oxo-3-hexenedioate decarboxylase